MNQPVVTAPHTQTVATTGVPHASPYVAPLGQTNNFQQPRYEPTFIRNDGPQRTGPPMNAGTASTINHVAPVAKLSAVNISTSNDNEGSENALGSVIVVNDSDVQLNDFQLTLVANNTPTPLVPFEGDINYPMPISSMQIPPHGRLQVHVGTPNRYSAANIGARSVQLVAHFADGSSYTDRADLH